MIDKHSTALLSSPLSVDIDRVLGDLHSSFNPLHKDFLLDFHVSGARDGFVFLTIALPEGMTRVFVSMLESMSGFFRFIDIKARAAVGQSKAHDPALKLQAEKNQVEFRNEVLSLFDGFIGQGLEPKEAVKRTNSALKARNNPWATHEVVQGVVRASGRFRTKRGRPQGNERSE